MVELQCPWTSHFICEITILNTQAYLGKFIGLGVQADYFSSAIEIRGKVLRLWQSVVPQLTFYM